MQLVTDNGELYPDAMSTHVHRLRIYRVSLPMRVSFKHAAAERRVTENLVVELELGDGVTGWGEAIPRPYVSGETLDSAVLAIKQSLVEPLLSIRPAHFSDVLPAAEGLPFYDAEGQPITSARAAVELALLDAYARHFGRSFEDIAGWMGSPLFGSPGSSRTTRYGGVVSAGDPARTLRRIRLQRLLGLGDFKLKVGGPDDREVIAAVAGRYRRRIEAGKFSLRADANGAFTAEQAAEWLRRMDGLPLASLEQPLAADMDAQLPALRQVSNVPLMVDESLITAEDAKLLITLGAADMFNIRISKNGGLMAAMRLAEIAHQAGLGYQLGCMVGETGLLSAAGRWFLHLVRGVRFAEGSFGRWLLADDITRPSPRFGFGGRIKPLTGPGLGVRVGRDKLARYSTAAAIEIPL